MRLREIYIAAIVRMLAASGNIFDPRREDNSEYYNQYNYTTYVPERNVIGNDTYNNQPITRESHNTEIPTYQYNYTTPEIQPYENRQWAHSSYNNQSMMWGSQDTQMPAYQYNYTAQQPYENSQWDYSSYGNQPMMWESQNTQIPTNSETGNRVYLDRDGEGGDKITIEHLVTEIRQSEQKLSLGKQLAEDEHGKRIEELIRKQEAERSKDNLEAMPISSLTEEYMPSDLPECSHNSVIPQLVVDLSYEYSNFRFLKMLLYSPSPSITADSIRTRFGAQFFSFLSPRQIVRVLGVLLENRLQLSSENQREFIEKIFGHIDYSPMVVIPKEQLVILVETMMKSSVPEYFEQVFLTWKLWYDFTTEDQELMLKNINVKRGYKRETLVMLYLFVISIDGNNSQWCEILRSNIRSHYEDNGIIKKGYKLKDIVIKGERWETEMICNLFETFDMCLLDLSEVFKNMDGEVILPFRNYIRVHFFAQHHGAIPYCPRYKIHVCYVLTKFTKDSLQKINEDGNENLGAYKELYFDLIHIKKAFKNWIKIQDKNYHSDNKLKEEFMNAFGMIRQAMQSDKCSFYVFLELFDSVVLTKTVDKPYLILLFVFTKENMLMELDRSTEWHNEMNSRTAGNRCYRFLEDFFMYNINPTSEFYHQNFSTKICPIKIFEVLFKLNNKGSIIMHREHYFCQHILFHPQCKIFDGDHMSNYIKALSKTGQLDSKEKCNQIARDLVFSEYYHETVVKVKANLRNSVMCPKLNEFKKCIERECREYKKKGAIEIEREMFRSC
ncbi:hypothetical protein PAEPH01_0394 [Pancytospora epiphaga]|nr:hypothetical protein PAEPH01_0394 [Pancytospora epiphaga]